MLTEEDKEWLKTTCGKVERAGLYFLVFLILLSSCSLERRVNEIAYDIRILSQTIGE